LTQRLKNGDFQSIFNRSASAVTSAKKFNIRLIGSPLCGAVQWAQGEQCTLPLSPQGAAQKRSGRLAHKSEEISKKVW